MEFRKEMLQFYAITHGAWQSSSQSLADQVALAVEHGVTCVQLREKTLEDDALVALANSLKEICHHYKIPLLMNDRLDIALKIGADGAHLGQKDLSIREARAILKEKGQEMILGATAPSITMAQEAEAQGADYIGAGAVFGTQTKKDAKPLAMEKFREICGCTTLPVVAIGGITEENIHLLANTGLSGVALVSAIFASEDIPKSCKFFRNEIENLVQ